MAIANKNIATCSPIAGGACKEDVQEGPRDSDGITICVPPHHFYTIANIHNFYVEVQAWPEALTILAPPNSIPAVAPQELRGPCRR